MLTCHPGARVIGREHIRFGDPVIIDDFAFVYAKAPLRVGDYVHIAVSSSVIAVAEVDIGDFAAVSHGARVLSATDDFKGWGFGNSTVPPEFRNVTAAPVRIGRFCIVGANAVVLPGVTLGEGATVGACSVVTRDLAPWGVYIGNRRIAERDRDAVLANVARFRAGQGGDP
jgi:galactoside O-acetyltransferase